MTEKRTKLSRLEQLRNIPEMSAQPAVRCGERVDDSPRNRCGKLADFVLRGGWWFDDEYFCAAHRPSDASEILAEIIVRRVRVSCDVLIASVSMNATIGDDEALVQLRAVLRPLGAVLQVREVRSTVGRYPAPGGRPAAPPGSDNPE